MDKCDYGCGRVSTITFNNGSKCCSKSCNSCPAKKAKDSLLKRGSFTGTPFWKIPDYKKREKKAWNKGMTFQGDDRWKGSGRKGAETKRRKGFLGGAASTPDKESIRRLKISQTMKGNPKAGGLREGSGRGKKQWYDSPIAGRVYLRSSYEIGYAKWLDENGIAWKQNLDKFPYPWNGVTRFYYPDFFLVDEHRYVEIKGYKTQQDEAKWAAFPFRLTVLKRNDLQQMGILVK